MRNNMLYDILMKYKLIILTQGQKGLKKKNRQKSHQSRDYIR